MRATMLASLLAIAIHAAAQAAEWKQVPSGASHVLTADAALGLTRTEDRLQVADGYTHFTEVVVLSNRGDDAAFLLIYQESYPTQAWSYVPELSRLAESLKLYQGKPYTLGSESTSSNHLGVVKHVAVTTGGRLCLLFAQGFGAPDQEFRGGASSFKRLVVGNYCPGRAKHLTPELVARALASYGIKGVAGPTLTQ